MGSTSTNQSFLLPCGGDWARSKVFGKGMSTTRRNNSSFQKKGSTYTVLWVFLALIGIVVLLLSFFSIGFIILGVLLLFAAYFVFQQDKDLKASIQEYQSEGSRFNSEIEEKTNVLSQQVFSELSAIHEARSRPVTPAGPSQIVKETIVKEVVMIPCAYCRSLMPQTSTFCPNCGARRKS